MGMVEADPAQSIEQDVGHRVEPQAELIGLHGGRRGAIGDRGRAGFVDTVLRLAAGAVELLVEILGLALVAPQRGDNKAGIGFALASARPWRRRGAGGSSSPRRPMKLLKRRSGRPVRRLLAAPRSARPRSRRQAARCAPGRTRSRRGSLHTNPSDRPERSHCRRAAGCARRGHRRRICATMRAISSTAPSPHRGSHAAAGRGAGVDRRTRRAADSSSNRSSRGRIGPPARRAADRRCCRDRA